MNWDLMININTNININITALINQFTVSSLSYNVRSLCVKVLCAFILTLRLLFWLWDLCAVSFFLKILSCAVFFLEISSCDCLISYCLILAVISLLAVMLSVCFDYQQLCLDLRSFVDSDHIIYYDWFFFLEISSCDCLVSYCLVLAVISLFTVMLSICFDCWQLCLDLKDLIDSDHIIHHDWFFFKSLESCLTCV